MKEEEKKVKEDRKEDERRRWERGWWRVREKRMWYRGMK